MVLYGVCACVGRTSEKLFESIWDILFLGLALLFIRVASMASQNARVVSCAHSRAAFEELSRKKSKKKPAPDIIHCVHILLKHKDCKVPQNRYGEPVSRSKVSQGACEFL